MKDLTIAMDNVEITYGQVVDVANNILSNTFKPINDLISNIEENVINLTVDSIRDYMVRLQLKAYSLSELKDKASLKAECAESLRKEKYAISLIEAEGTTNVKDNKATLASSDEIVVEMLYELIANLVKTKLDQLHRLTNVLQNVLISRMQEAKYINLSAADDPDQYKTLVQIQEENSRQI